MKKMLLVAAIGAAALSITNASANTKINTNIIKLPAQEVQDTSLHNFQVSRDAYRDFQGEYRLTSGGTLRLSQYGGGIYAHVDGQPKMEVRASSGNTFVSTNGRTELVFEQDHTGTVTTVKLTQWANKATA
jgi:hypothetical protein